MSMLNRWQRSLAMLFALASRWRAQFVLTFNDATETQVMPFDKNLTAASEALVGMPLPKMLEGLGLAVAKANEALAAHPGPTGTVMTINKATVDLNIAISVQSSETVGGELKLELKAFSVNASYARTFGFKEEASSRISMELAVVAVQPT
jgi:hypothetical protein